MEFQCRQIPLVRYPLLIEKTAEIIVENLWDYSKDFTSALVGVLFYFIETAKCTPQTALGCSI